MPFAYRQQAQGLTWGPGPGLTLPPGVGSPSGNPQETPGSGLPRPGPGAAETTRASTCVPGEASAHSWWVTPQMVSRLPKVSVGPKATLSSPDHSAAL